MIKLWYLLIVGLIVFTGALMIAEGLRTAPQETAQSSDRAFAPDAPEFAI